MVKTANEIFADYVIAGVPSSGAHKPRKDEIRSWGSWLESLISLFSATAGSIGKQTRALLYGDLGHASAVLAWVYADPIADYNGIYKKSGASGVGSWEIILPLPYSFIVASDVGAGTANAIQATTSIPVSGSALVWMNVFEPNTSSPVTVSFNGGTPLTIKTNTGNDIAAGGLASGMIVLGIVSGSTFRLVNDQVSSAIIAAAEAAAERAEDAAASIQTVMAFGAVGDGATNDAAAFAAALAGTGAVRIPHTQNGFKLTSGITIPAGKKLVFDDGAKLKFSGAMGHCITISAADGVLLKNVEIDASAVTGTDEIIYIENSSDVTVTVKKITGSATGRAAVHAKDCPRVKIIGEPGARIVNAKSNAVTVEGLNSTGFEVDWLHFEGTDPGLCIHLTNSANNGSVHHNRSLTSGAEIVGEQYSCFNNSICDNYAFEPQDAGISKTGKNGIVSRNIIERAEFHGIAIFGEGNVVDGNIMIDPGISAPTGDFAGISCYSAWGGVARNNIGRGNIAINKNGTSMAAAVRFAGEAYGQWVTATAYADRTFISNGNNLYVSVGAGTSGATAPVHTSGTASDGGVTWEFIRTDADGFYPRDNDIECFDFGTSRVAPYIDLGYGWRNVARTSAAEMPSSELRGTSTQEWVSGASASYGDVRTATASNGVKRVYVSVGTGTTGATKPTHTSGIVSDGAVSWRYMGDGDQLNGIDMSGTSARVINVLHLISPAGVTRKLHMPNASPEGLVVGDIGDIAIRPAGGVGSSAYMKETGNGTATGWVPLEGRRSGTTANRPTGLAASHAALSYLDTTLGKPIWWNGSAWKDATGTTV